MKPLRKLSTSEISILVKELFNALDDESLASIRFGNGIAETTMTLFEKCQDLEIGTSKAMIEAQD